MTKLQDFRVDFDRPGATYAPGETVHGRVFIRLSGTKNVKEIRLEVRGEAETHWTKKHREKDSSGRSQTRLRDYKGNEHYFSVTNRLSGSSDNTTIPAGEHTYHFSFQLPVNIPCSIEHKLGYVRYTVKAILERPWRFDHKIISAFSVVSPYDLNSQFSLATGINEQCRRNFRRWCLISDGGVSVNLKSRVRGFVPGETIELIVNYDNNSTRVDMTKIKLKLEKNLTFHTTVPKDKKNVNEIIKKAKQVGPFSKKGEASMKIEVPPLPPSRLENCSLIDVSYKLHLSIHVSGLRFPIKKTYPIEIGTVPLNYRTPIPQQPAVNPYLVQPTSVIEHASPNPGVQQQTLQPIGFVVMSSSPGVINATPSAPQHQSISDSEMPPPSYEECFSGAKAAIADPNDPGVHGANVEFAPRYPVYRLSMPMPYSS